MNAIVKSALAGAALLLTLPVFGSGVPEEIQANNYPNGTATIKYGVATVTGGVIHPTAMSPYLTGKTYFTQNGCTGCLNTITLKFSKPVSDLKITMASHPYYNTHFFFNDDKGNAAPLKFGCQYYCDGVINFPNPGTVVWNPSGIQTLTITASNDGYSPASFWYFGISDISYTVAPDYGIVARLGVDPNAPNEPAPVLFSSSSTARIPLGRTFSIRLKRKYADGTWHDEPATFALQAGTIQGGAARPDQTLFINSPIFLYNQAPDGATRLLQSVHLGTAPLRITPTNTALPPLTLNLTSIDPASLGTGQGNNTTFDDRFKAQAHIRGIPPQYLKAIAAHETGNTFNPHAWRYEPRADRYLVAPLRSSPPQHDFVLPAPTTDAGGFSLGRWLCPLGVNVACGFPDIDDLAPKGGLSYTRSGVTTPIPPYGVNDHITIREICNGNPRQNWPCQAPPTTSTPTAGLHRAVGVDPWAIVANPHMASSYGIMQSTWYSVIEGHVWDGATAAGSTDLRLNPSLLFDDVNNIARGSASVVVGANELRYDFTLMNGSSSGLNANYDTFDDFAAQMRTAIIKYNGGGSGAIDYADNKVLPLVPLYLGVLPANTSILSVPCSGAPSVSATAAPTIAPGTSILLEAVADRADHYQWYEGANGDTSRPLGTDSSTIAVAPSATTSYWVSASNSCGVTAASTTVSVAADCTPPRALAATPDQTIVLNATVGLSVTAADTDTQQWYALTDDGTLTMVPGATTASVTVQPLVSTTYFDVLSNACESARSPFIRVTVTSCAPPSITASPAAQSVLSGGTAHLEVTATGSDPITYQWYAGPTGVTSAPVPGGTSRTVDVSPTAATPYWVRVSNGCGTADSAAATVSIASTCQPVTVTAGPVSVAIATGDTTTLSVTVAGTAPQTYQWYLGASGDTTQPVAGGTDRSLTVTAHGTQQYWVRATNPCGSADSAAATVTVTACAPPAIISSTSSQQVLTGGALPLSVTATGSGPLSYQWYSGVSGDTSRPITGATAATYPVVVLASTTYWARVSNLCGTANTPSIVLTESTCFPPTISQQPSGASIAIGTSASLSVSASGQGPLAYQWFEGATGDDTHPVPGGTDLTISVRPQSTTSYWVRVSNVCGSTSSTTATVTITGTCVPATIVSQVQSTTIIIGAFADLRVTAGGTDPVTYQWYVGASGDLSTPVAGATAATLRVSPSTTTSYWVRISNACGSALSATGTVTVLPCDAAEITSQPSSITIPQGSVGYLSVDASGTDPKTVQWFIGASGDESQPTYFTAFTIPVSPSETTSYWALVSNACGTSISAAATVVVLPPCSPASITAGPSSAQITSGASTALSVAASGTDPLSYQWFVGQAGDETSPIPGATSTSITITPSSSTDYFVEVTNACGVAMSATATVTVVPACSTPQITTEPLAQTIIAGSSIQLSVDASGTAPLTYTWFAGAAPDTSQQLGSGASLTITPTATNSYWVRVSNACGMVDSDAAMVTVAQSCTSPSVSATATPTSITAGQSASLSATASGTAPLTYTWYLGSASDTSQPVGSAPSLSVSPSQSASYWVRVSNACGFADSAVLAITVTQPCDVPTISLQPQSQSITTGGTVMLSISASGTAPLSYQWYENGSPLAGATEPLITVTPLSTTDYFVRVSNACGSTDSDIASITVNPGCGGCGQGPGGGPQQNAPTALASPTHLTAVTSKQGVTALTWRSVAPIDRAVWYQIWRADGASTFKPVATSSAVVYHDHGAAKGHAYRYFVVATDASGVRPSAPSNIATTTPY